MCWSCTGSSALHTTSASVYTFLLIQHFLQFLSIPPPDCRNDAEDLSPSLVDSMRDAVFTVSPNRQYLGILVPTTPATTGPETHTGLHTSLIKAAEVLDLSVWT